MPEESIIKLIKGLSDIVPIVSVEDGTFSVTNRIGTIRPRIYAENTDKITTSIQEFEKHIPINGLAERLVTFTAAGLPPGCSSTICSKGQNHRKSTSCCRREPMSASFSVPRN